MKGGEPDIVLPRGIRVPYGEISFEYSRSGGPGGQRVNKVNSRVTLRFDVARSPSLTDEARTILLEKMRPRLTNEGVLVLHASERRDQAQNRDSAVARLRLLLAEALTPKKKRRPTKPTRGSVERRIQARKLRSDVKRLRRRPDAGE